MDAKKTAATHPSYNEMIGEAITALKDRTGSSQFAIVKYVEEKHKNLPGNFKKILSVQLKRLIASGKLTKVKNSYKLAKPISDKKAKAPTDKKKETKAMAGPAKKKADPAKKKAVLAKGKAAPAKTKAAPAKEKTAPAKKMAATAKAKLTPKKRKLSAIVEKPKVKKLDDTDSPQEIPSKIIRNHVTESTNSPDLHNGSMNSNKNSLEPSAISASKRDTTKEQNDNLLDAQRLADGRKRLLENYREAENAKKQRTLQVTDIHEIPRPKKSFMG